MYPTRLSQSLPWYTLPYSCARARLVHRAACLRPQQQLRGPDQVVPECDVRRELLALERLRCGQVVARVRQVARLARRAVQPRGRPRQALSLRGFSLGLCLWR